MIKRILIIDDDVDFAEACCNFLEAAGYETSYETDASKALEKIQASKPDLILLDVVMQEQDSGFRLAELLNRDLKLRQIPVIFLTGYFKKTESQEQQELIKKWPNVYGVLDKPVKPSILMEVVQKVSPDTGR
ncbi:MAG TPA: response regulator [bacterium]|nr:response regulator [bacterium]HPP12819.1 response regulator [bacterium]